MFHSLPADFGRAMCVGVQRKRKRYVTKFCMSNSPSRDQGSKLKQHLSLTVEAKAYAKKESSNTLSFTRARNIAIAQQ